MDRNRDLALPLPLPAGSCCDHKGLGPADRRSCRPADNDYTFLRWSRPAMSPHLHTRAPLQRVDHERAAKTTYGVYIGGEQDKAGASATMSTPWPAS
jgi:hypothetical protein